MGLKLVRIGRRNYLPASFAMKMHWLSMTSILNRILIALRDTGGSCCSFQNATDMKTGLLHVNSVLRVILTLHKLMNGEGTC